MLAIKILQKLIKQSKKQKTTTPSKQNLSGFHVDLQPGMREIQNQIASGQTTNVSVEFSGDVPSAASELAQKFTKVGAGYGLSKITLEKRTNPELGAAGDDVPAVLGISLGSWIASSFLQYYVFDALLGTTVPKTKINIDVDDISDLDTQNVLTSSQATNTVIGNAIASFIGAEFVSNTWDSLEFLANTYHGYQRHDKSLLAGIGWGLFGNIGMAIQQGYGLPMQLQEEGRFLDMPSMIAIHNPKAKKRRKTTKGKAHKSRITQKTSHKSRKTK